MKHRIPALLSLVLMGVLGVQIADCWTTLVEEREVEVVGACFERAHHKRTDHLLVKWDDKIVRLPLNPFAVGKAKAGDRVVVQVRKSRVWGFRSPLRIKED